MRLRPALLALGLAVLAGCTADATPTLRVGTISVAEIEVRGCLYLIAFAEGGSVGGITPALSQPETCRRLTAPPPRTRSNALTIST